LEKGWSEYLEEHPTKHGIIWSVQQIINKFKEEGTMERKKGSGRPRSVITKENEEIVKQMIYSQEDAPHTHMSPREIKRNTRIRIEYSL